MMYFLFDIQFFAGKGYDNKRRGRSKKSLDILRAGVVDTTPSPGGGLPPGLMDGFPPGPGPDGIMHPGFPFHPHHPHHPHAAADIRLRPDFGSGGGRMSPNSIGGGPQEFYPGGAEGGWAAAEFMGYGGHIPPPDFRPGAGGYCEVTGTNNF